MTLANRTFETLLLHVYRYCVQHCYDLMSATDAVAYDEARTTQILMSDGREAVARLVAEAYGWPPMTQVWEWPLTWWDALKQRWFPRWWLRRWPIRKWQLTVESQKLLTDELPGRHVIEVARIRKETYPDAAVRQGKTRFPRDGRH